MKQFISVADVADMNALLEKAAYYKKYPHADTNKWNHIRLAMMFFNPSLRTRMSMQIAAKNLGMDAVVFNTGSEAWALELEDGAIMNGTTVEHIKDAAAVLGQYFDMLCIRTFPSLKNREEDYAEKIIHQLSTYSGVPVISLESATLHPLQSLADVMTIEEAGKNLNRKPKVVLTWAPHIKALPQCVSNSFSQWINAWGKADFTITHPEGYELAEQFTGNARIEYDQQKALEDADFVYVKNWSSYREYGKTIPVADDWMLTEEKLKVAPLAHIMHCLPVRRNVELSHELLDGKRSLVQQQAGNRVYAAQAVLATIAAANEKQLL